MRSSVNQTQHSTALHTESFTRSDCCCVEFNELHMPDLWKETMLGTVAGMSLRASASAVSYLE